MNNKSRTRVNTELLESDFERGVNNGEVIVERDGNGVELGVDRVHVAKAVHIQLVDDVLEINHS